MVAPLNFKLLNSHFLHQVNESKHIFQLPRFHRKVYDRKKKLPIIIVIFWFLPQLKELREEEERREDHFRKELDQLNLEHQKVRIDLILCHTGFPKKKLT